MKIKCCGDEFQATHLESRKTDGDTESEKDRRRDWEECEEWMSGFCECVYACSYIPMHTIDSPPRAGVSFFFVLFFCLRGCTFSKSVCVPGCDCVLVAAAVGGRGCKDIKKGKKTFFSFHLCASAVVPASVPSAMGTKTTVTTHSFSWRAVACGRIGDFSQGYLWHCWSLILRVGALCRPIPRPRHSPSHIQQNPFLYLAISLSPSFHLMLSLVDQNEYWWAHV